MESLTAEYLEFNFYGGDEVVKGASDFGSSIISSAIPRRLLAFDALLWGFPAVFPFLYRSPYYIRLFS